MHEEEHSDADSTETIEVWSEEDRTADAVKDPAPIFEEEDRQADAAGDPELCRGPAVGARGGAERRAQRQP
jgi:hypothetical protein